MPAESGAGAMLSVEGLHVAFAGVTALRDAGLAATPGEITGLVGRNGAGKTTTLKAILGLVSASGSVRLGERLLDGMPAHARARLGIGWMPEDRRLVPGLSVRDNALAPAWAAGRDGVAEFEAVLALMPELVPLAGRPASLLSGGQQKLAALARALVAGQRLLLLDEPTEGIAPALARRLGEVLVAVRAQGRTILVAESDGRHLGALFGRSFRIERGVVSPL